MPRHTNVQHGRELGVGVQRTWARPWQIWPLTLDDHETAAAPARPRTSTQAPRLSRPNHERPERRVAVKQLYHQSGASAREAELANQRALREAQLTARQALIADRYRLLHCVGCGGFQHPHAVWVFDAVEQDGELTRQLDPCRADGHPNASAQWHLRHPREPRTLQDLTQRELEVFTMISRGFANDQIAKALVVSESTVKTHVNRILAKLDLRNRVPAVVLACRVRSDPPRRERRLSGYVAC